MLYFNILFSAFFSVFFIVPAVILLAKRLKLLDDKNRRRHPAALHTGVIPRAGGLAIYSGLLLTMLFFLPLTKNLLAILAGGLLIVVTGLIDDYRDVNPYLRLMFNVVSALLAISGGNGIPFVSNPFGGVIRLDSLRITFDMFGNHSILVWADLAALLWIVWNMNIVGWSGGVDGQLPGFTAIAAFCLSLLSFRFTLQDPSQWIVPAFGFAVTGVYLGFLPWNYYPQKIMPGYGGKALAGYLLAVLAIFSSAKVGAALLVLGVPIIDAVYTISRRLWQKRSPVWADNHHLHHQLLMLGWGKRRVALFYWLITAVLGLCALYLNSRQKLFIFVGSAVVIWGALYSLKIFKENPRE